VVPGFVEHPKRKVEDTRAIRAYNERISTDPRLTTSIVPLRDGVSISVKRGSVAS
jgi:predicted O-methyltransferase YrrM